MKTKQRTIILFMISIMVLLVGCGNKNNSELSKLGKINVVTREEGAGTRTDFENLIDTQEDGTNTVVSSTDEVIEKVAADKSAIGYVAYSALKDNQDIKVLSVGGKQPTLKNIKNGNYELYRYFYLACGLKKNALENDFMSYVTRAGQNIVAEYTIPVKEAIFFVSKKPQGKLVICGSSSAEPVVRALAEDYQTYNPNAEIEIVASDSSLGITDAIQGNCNIAMTSRTLKGYEKELLNSKVIAKDAIAVIVNKDNPMDEISKKDLKKIYDKTYENWSDL